MQMRNAEAHDKRLGLLLADHASLDEVVTRRLGTGPLPCWRFPASGLRLNGTEEVRVTIQGQPTMGDLCTFIPNPSLGYCSEL